MIKKIPLPKTRKSNPVLVLNSQQSFLAGIIYKGLTQQ